MVFKLHLAKCEWLHGLRQDPYCGAYMVSNHGGVLALGSTIWSNGTYPAPGRYMAGWKLVDADIRNATNKLKIKPQCFNANGKTFGSFGMLYHENVFPEMLAQIKAAAGTKPFDHLLASVADAGFVVRAALPHLVLQDVRHESRIDPSRKHQSDLAKRAELHRWRLRDFEVNLR